MKKVLFSIEDLKIGNDIKNDIEEALKERKLETIFLNNDLEKTMIYKLFRECTKKISCKNYLKKIFIKYEENIKKNKIAKYKELSYIFFISGGEFSESSLKLLKDNNPSVKMILFLWDKLEYSYWENKVKYFDYIFSYDRIEAKKNNFIFRPTFFINECLNNLPKEKEYSLCYVGALRDKKRYEYIKNLKNYLERNNLKFFLKLYVDKNTEKYLPKNYDKNLIINKRISYLENIDILKKSKVVLDMKYQNQNGLTLRVYEALATNTKIITDNEDIKNYDFYNKNNIKIIKNIDDIENIPVEFFKIPAIEIDKKIKDRYSVKGFIDEIFKKVDNLEF